MGFLMGQSAKKLQPDEVVQTTLTQVPQQDWWFIAREAELHGPFSTQQMVEKITKREVYANDFCWKKGFMEWRPLFGIADFDELILPNVYSVNQYPRIDIPFSKKNIAPTLVRSDNTFQQVEKVVISQVTKTKKVFSIYEIALAVIFMLGFAYLTATVSLNILSEQLMTKIDRELKKPFHKNHKDLVDR